MTRHRIPLERVDAEYTSVGWGSQVTTLASVVVFLFLGGALAWTASTKRQEELAAKATAKGAGPTDDGQSKLRAEFLGTLSKSLQAVGVDHAVDTKAGEIRVGPASVSFKVAQAWLLGKPLEEVDKIGAVFAKAASCLPKAPSAYQAPGVAHFESAVGMQACTTPDLLGAVAFECKPQFAKLALEAILVEGHADARPYAPAGRKFKDNLALSSARGETVMRRMYACNPDLASFSNARGLPLLGVGSYSSQRPVPDADPLAESNRRVEFRFLLDAGGKGKSGAKAAKAGADDAASETAPGAGAVSLPAKASSKAGNLGPVPEQDLVPKDELEPEDVALPSVEDPSAQQETAPK